MTSFKVVGNLLLFREVDGRDGAKLLVVDAFPEEFTITAAALGQMDEARLCADLVKGRLWVQVDNGRAEYVLEPALDSHAYRCLRLYQDVQWTPEPAPAPATAAPDEDVLCRFQVQAGEAITLDRVRYELAKAQGQRCAEGIDQRYERLLEAVRGEAVRACKFSQFIHADYAVLVPRRQESAPVYETITDVDPHITIGAWEYRAIGVLD